MNLMSLIDGSVHVETDVVEQELVGGIAAIRLGIHEAGSQSGANRNRTQVDLRPRRRGQYKEPQQQKQSGGTSSRNERPFIADTSSKHE